MKFFVVIFILFCGRHNVIFNESLKNHIMSCDVCADTKYNLNSFKIIKKCNSNFKTKIHEALLIKNYNLGLNRKLFANGLSFLLNTF